MKPSWYGPVYLSAADCSGSPFVAESRARRSQQAAGQIPVNLPLSIKETAMMPLDKRVGVL